MDQMRSRPLDEYDMPVVIPLMKFVFSGFENWTCIDEGLSESEEEALERLVYAGLFAKKHSGQLWLRDHELRVDLTFEHSGGWHQNEPNDRERLVREVLSNLPLENADEEVPVSSAILQIQCSFARLTIDGQRRRSELDINDWPELPEIHNAICKYVCEHSTRDTAVQPSLKVQSQTPIAGVPGVSDPERFPPMEPKAKNLRFGKYVDDLIEEGLTWSQVVERGCKELGGCYEVSQGTYRNAHANYWREVNGKEPPKRAPGPRSSSK